MKITVYSPIIMMVAILSFNQSCNNTYEICTIKEISLLPLPQKIEKGLDTFLLNEKTNLIFDEKDKDLASIGSYLKNYLKDNYQFELLAKNGNPSIHLLLEENFTNEEAYTLKVDSVGIEIRGKTPRAVFYGVQSLLQILPSEKKKFGGFKIPSVKIADEPQFKWRGLHLDVCRHFFEVAEIKKLLNVAASLKINTFHWHLTEDQGWRIEIKKYPKLTEIGAWRKAIQLNHAVEYPLKFDYTKYGGYYTQEQIKEVVEYAKSRFITIVPEIEMPGHAVAALAAYPQYSCNGGPFEVLTEWGVSNDVFCPGKDETFGFIEDILTEVIALFPGEYIHVGGDECPKIRWKLCPACQNRMKTEKLKNENELQSYFIRRVEKFLSLKGKKLIGWDEILEGGIPERAAVMSWRGENGGIEAASNGHDVVMTPNDNCYFDHYQGIYNEPLAIGGLTTLKDVYNYLPVPNGLAEQYKKHILGSQANLWTEYIPTKEHLEYMIFPRLCALAENLWTNENIQNYDYFIKRMDDEYKRLDLYKVNYRINPPEGFEEINKTLDDSFIVKLDNGIPSSEIKYTLDGTEPNENSQLYINPLVLKLSQKQSLKAISIMKNGRKSQVISGSFEKFKFLEPIQKENLSKGISYIYYEDTVLSAFSIKAKDTRNGIVSNFRLPKDIRHNFFGISFTGYIQIAEDNVYTFYTQSDDGSVLFIDNELIVNNNGCHWWEEKNGKVALKKGLHLIKVNYFQAKYGYSFGVNIESNKMRKQQIPDDMLFN
jgi:hexosaminidase